jgi:periodic tryptophan protein 2
VLHHMNFKAKVFACEFSPCGRSFAVCAGKTIQIWATPTMLKEFAPFRLLRQYGGMYDDATCVGWSADSRWVIVGSKDLTARVYSANHVEGYAPPTLAGHREPLVHVAFAGDAGDACFTVSKDGAVFEWRLEEAEEEPPGGDLARRKNKSLAKTKTKRWRMCGKHFFHQPAKLTCADYHRATGLLCAGFGHGVFTMHRLSPDSFEHVQTLSVSQEKVSACAFDETGDWIALGCAKLGQLVVWEWQSEAYVYKQQGHYFDVNACAYAPDGSMLATAADDHKVKVWSATTGSCFVTFAEHAAPVSAVAFLPTGHALLSASLDGTVRAFDLMRYRNFRVLTSPDPSQFVSLAVDPTGEIVCAGKPRSEATKSEKRKATPLFFFPRVFSCPARFRSFLFSPPSLRRRRLRSRNVMIVPKSNADAQ